MIIPILEEKAIVCMDDANYNFKHTNSAFINIVRKKMGLPLIKEIKDNSCDLFYIEVERYLKNYFNKVKKIEDSYKINFKKDLYFPYFQNELEIKASLKMENLEQLKHRFDAWRVN